MDPKPEISILFVEDIPEDAEMATRELRKAGLVFASLRVETREDFLEALENFHPDLIISDYSMPEFDGMKALKLSLERDPSIPFIILTGSKNEETAVLCLKSGAIDYVIKGSMSRLPFAAREALEHARAARESEASARELRESEHRYRTLADSGQALIWTSGVDKLLTWFNEPWLEFTGRGLDEERGNGWTRGVHPEDLERCVAAYESAFDRRQKFSMEYRLRRRDGAYRWIQDDGCPRYGSEGEFLGYIGHCLDITERVLDKERIRRSLEDKEALLRELFHRTRNNMQIIMAILAFEESAAHDERVGEALRRTSDRILSMSLVHEELYESLDLSRIDLKDYTEDLIGLLTSDDAFPRDRISVKCRANSVTVPVDVAMPFGLVLHELLANAYRHAFPRGAVGEVAVDLRGNSEGGIVLEVSDDGIGLPDDVEFGGRDGFGLQLIQGLVEEQLKGSLKLSSGHGLSCRVSFVPTKAISGT